MTLEEIRAMRGATSQETLLLEIAAQIAELNGNFKRFTELQEVQAGVRPIANYEIHAPKELTGVTTKEIKKAVERTPLAKVE